MTGLIHQYSEDFEPHVALDKMRSSKNWPRAEYIKASVSLPAIADMLVGLDCTYQADLVHVLRQTVPDISEICRFFSLSRSDMSGWDDIVRQLMMDDDEILSSWNVKRQTAANSGTWMHSMIEHMLNGYKISPGPMLGEMESIINYLSRLDNVEVYRTEWCICAPNEDLAGSIDLVLKDKDSNTFHLVDWKRSEKLEDKYAGYGKKMNPPAHDVDDCQGQHYRLQLNIYKWILERYYDVPVDKMTVVCVHPRYLPHGFVDEVPDMQGTVDKMMQCCRDKKAAASCQEREERDEHSQHAQELLDSQVGDDNLQSQQENQADAPDTLPFRVMLTGQDHQEDDMEMALEKIMLGEDDTQAPVLAKKRRLMPGAGSHAVDCRRMFERSMEIIKSTLDGYGADVCLQPNTIMQNTRSMLSSLQTKYPWMSEQLQRLIMIAGHMSTGKIGDKPMLPDAAAILWMVEGDRHMRVHKGFLFVYDDDGCFMPFGGIPPEAVLHRMHDFFSCLEGIFRRMKPEISRDANSVADAVAADLQTCETEDEYLTLCRTASAKRSQTPAYSQRLDAEDDGVPGRGRVNEETADSWTLEMASRSWKVSCVVKQELMQTRMISLLVEWCETEDRRSSTICYDDICLAYDRPGCELPVDVVRKGPQNDCYIRIPHPLLDAVLEANMERLQLFYERTFWCNLDVFKCFQAAIAIAKRGYNVDRCFIGISPGGVGQSLYSHHLSEMYKQNHSYFDPNIWHLDEELRKQVESFAKCFILTGQEAPETSRKLHIDLYMKTISGDGIMGRKPYGYSTRMFQMIGWTRLEVNKMMSFVGVTNNNFNSMFRRTFVWKAKARFIHEKFLTNYSDHEKDGIFRADPSLGKFLSTSQASIAGLKLQWAFEIDHSKADCYQLIEDYCNGGDGHLTEDVMREACGLPVRVRQVQEEDGLGNLLAAGQDSADERDEKTSGWINLRNYITTHMLEKDLDIMTWYEFKKMTFRPGEHPNLSKAEMWDQLKEHDVVRTALIRHKSSKDKPGAYIPRIVFAKEHCDICPQRSLDTIRMQFDEEIDIGLAKRYAYSCRGRSMNMDTMKAFYKSMMPASKKGRRTAEQEELMQTYQDLLQKLVDHEKSVAKLLSTKHGRRLRAKRSVEDDDGESSKQDSMFGREYLSMKHSRTISYSYSDKISYTVRARRYAVPDGVQSMSRRLQHHVVDGHTIDLDIQNCCLTLLQQIISKTAPQPPTPVDLVQLMDRLVKDRAGVLKELSLHTVEGKEMINTVLNGGSPPTSLRNNEIVQGLQKISLYVRWVACNLLHADYMSLADNKQKTFPSSTILSLLWTSVEDRILQSWTDHVLTGTTKPKHLSLHFDGIRISADHVGVQQEEFIRDCENAIHKRTGFVVKIVPKKHQNFIQMLKTRGTHANALTNVPDILLMQGNCIPCALWHVVPLSRPAVVAAMSNTSSAKNVDAKSAGYRDYRSVASMCGVDLIGCLGLPGTHVKSFMLHYEGNGVPHSVAVRVDASGVGVTIIDGATVYKLNMATLREIHCAAVDHATILSYWKRDPQDKGGDKSTTLLDMVAGAGDDPNDSDGDDSEGHEEGHPVELANRLSFDDENVPVFKDHILESLEKETNDVSNDLQKKSMRCEGRRQCPLCPFRAFTQLRLLRTHITKHHVKHNQYVCSGTKQVKVILALYDHAASSQSVCTELLQESAAILRETIQPPLQCRHNNIDKQIRLIFDATGPKYVNVSSIGSTMQVRRVRNLYYTHSFADLLLREMVLNHAQASRPQACRHA